MMNTKSKVAIYCRLSEEDRNKQHETDDSTPLHGSHPAVPFASGATSSHGLRLYGSIIITIERSWRQLLR